MPLSIMNHYNCHLEAASGLSTILLDESLWQQNAKADDVVVEFIRHPFLPHDPKGKTAFYLETSRFISGFTWSKKVQGEPKSPPVPALWFHMLLRFFSMFLIVYSNWCLLKLLDNPNSILREYPLGFGVRFAQTMSRFPQEKSPLLMPSPAPCTLLEVYDFYQHFQHANKQFAFEGNQKEMRCQVVFFNAFSLKKRSFIICLWSQHYGSEAPEPEHIRSWHVVPIEGFNDLWEDAKMSEVITYLGKCNSLRLPEEWQAVLPLS